LVITRGSLEDHLEKQGRFSGGCAMRGWKSTLLNRFSVPTK
jgi:hypothetical protein